MDLEKLDNLPTSGANKDRKAHLDKQKEINCGHCPYHRRENARPMARKRDDRYKNHRRANEGR